MVYCEKSVIFANDMELERHIEILLLDNDCVIVPGLGGFIAYHTDACYDAESASFIPPTRTAGFNPKLSMNDNLLAQSYVETYDISYPEAVKRIAAEAEMLKDMLERNGSYDIPGVGTLKINDKGGYDFIPFEAGLLTPEYYGLGCYEALRLVEPEVENDIIDDDTDSNDNHSKFIRIKLSTVRNIAAAAIAIFAFFLLSSPLGNSNQNVASVVSLQNSVFHKMMPIDFKHETDATPVTKTMVKKIEKNDVIVKDSVKTIAAEVKTTVEKEVVKNDEPVKPESYYSIVLASALSKHNASNYVERLTAQGYENIHAVECSNGMKVVSGMYESERDAYSSLSSLRSKNEDFKDAWIYKVRTKK